MVQLMEFRINNRKKNTLKVTHGLDSCWSFVVASTKDIKMHQRKINIDICLFSYLTYLLLYLLISLFGSETASVGLTLNNNF